MLAAMTPPAIRPSTEADLPAIAAIYGHHVRHGLASFEYDPPPAEELGRRRAEVLRLFLPHLVAEADGRVLGFAYASLYRTRPGYAHVVEDSVYVAPDATGRGAGRALLGAVIDACTAMGRRQMVAVIGDSANAGSIGLHRAMGFRIVGTLSSIGWKHGRWVDSVLMQRALGDGDATPAPDRTTLPG